MRRKVTPRASPARHSSFSHTSTRTNTSGFAVAFAQTRGHVGHVGQQRGQRLVIRFLTPQRA